MDLFVYGLGWLIGLSGTAVVLVTVGPFGRALTVGDVGALSQKSTQKSTSSDSSTLTRLTSQATSVRTV